ncbi:hypothetical protein A8L34_17120 [Bacillus sp. FJAT-27264]|uniref:S-layer homology domain-containing protein n=1 Tax=Paenibacillus sp. (strain DSM 101736 / FJAT-27264) TaxID=1850362 RepID=UPI00080804BC|nr:S-layer homology domain-containing protein [Bacillus sp. FJAT-27264]OBZ12031.1 hypothetical protein A8L34_17120 [Bacillus sp. FJAT-27264]
MKKNLSIFMILTLLLPLFTAGPFDSAYAAESENGTVQLSGDPSFDSDSVANSAANQWRWLSYPGARFSLNPNKGSVSLDQGKAPMANDLAFNIGGFLGAGQVQFYGLMNAKIAESGQNGNTASSINTTWYPYKIDFNATYNTPSGVNMSGYDYFTDADSSVVRVMKVNGNANKDLILGGTIAGSGSARWDAEHQVLVVSDASYFYALKFVSLTGSELTASPLSQVPVINGSSWSLRIPVGVASGNTYATGFGFAASEEGVEKAISRASGNFAQGVSASLAATKAVFDSNLRKAPAPQNFGIAGGIDSKGVTAQQHRMFYYGAFAFFLNNYMNVLPENTAHFNYPQVLLGKASTWGFGAAYNNGSVAWESFLGQEWLSYMMPREAWEAYTGTMSLVGEDGYIPGEVLPARKAQAAWVIYRNGGASKEELAQQYGSIRRNLLWLEQNPRWIYISHDQADEKDLEFMASFLFDADFASRIAQEIGQPEAEIKMWKDRKNNMEKDIREWFLTNPNKLNQYYFKDSNSYKVGEYESILNAIYLNSLTDAENRMLIDFWRGMANANAPVNGQFYKYGVMSLNVYAMYNKGYKGDARQIIYTAIRDTVKAGNFSENIQPTGSIEGVSPSTFTAAGMIDFTLMANGLETYTGEPRNINLGTSWGETALPDIEDFNYVSDWSISSDAHITASDGIGRVAVNDNSGRDYGHVGKRVSYNVTDNPSIHIKVTQVDPGGKWALKVTDGGTDIALQNDTEATGEFSYNLKDITGWSGSKSFVIKMYASGGKGKSYQVDYLATEPLSDVELALDKQSFVLGQNMQISYKGASGQKDWLGIYKDDGGEPGENNPPLARAYKSNEDTASGTVSFDANWAPGNYRVFLLKNDGYTVAASAQFRITAPSAPGQVYLTGAVSASGYLTGTLAISPPSNSTYVQEYVLYWGDRNGKLSGVQPIAVVPAAIATVNHELTRVPVPDGAEALIIYSRTKGFESLVYAADELPKAGLQPLQLADFTDVSDWTVQQNANIASVNGLGRVEVNPGRDYGHVDKELSYNISDLPLIRVKIDGLDSGAKWALKVNTGYDFNDDITLQRDTDQTGEFTYNLREITGWKNARTFTIKLYAVGGQGKSFRISELSALPVEPVLTVPGEPTGVQASASNESAIVRFAAPADNGGSEILRYTVTVWSDDNAVKMVEGTGSPVTVSDLSNGTAYTFTVTASNAQGDSAVSTRSNEVTPTTELPPAPLRPENLNGMAGDKQVKLTWDETKNTVSYAVYQYEGVTAPADPDRWVLVAPSVTTATYTVNGLSNGTSYAFAVKAVNAGGESDFSAAVTATPSAAVPQTPAVPTLLTSTAGDKEVTLKWEAVKGADAYAVYQYEGTTAPINSSDWVLVQSGVIETTYTITGLTNGTGYAFAVKALNSGGASDYSAAATAVPTAAVLPEHPDTSGNSGSSVQESITIKSDDGKITIPSGRNGEVTLGNQIVLSVPAGVADQDMMITIEKLLHLDNLLRDKNKTLVSDVFEITKNLVGHFKKPVTLTLKFDPSLAGKDQRVSIFYYDEAKKTWVEVGGTVKGDWITAEVDHFTKFAVMAVDGSLGESSQSNQPAPAFADIIGHWAESYIRDAVGNKLVSGYPDGTFKPGSPVTRAEFTVMLINGLKLEKTGSVPPFSDQSKFGAWAQEAIATAAEAGLVSGYKDNSFRPDSRITRAEMAVMIARALDLTTDSGAMTSLADDTAIPQWAKGAVEAMHKLEIVNGRSDDKFVPNDTATRAEAVVMLLRMLAIHNNQ